MQTLQSKTSKLTTNFFQRQNRAIVNLQQLSQSPWHHPYQDTNTINQPIVQEKHNTNTHQSTQLPLNPKQKHYESPIRPKLKSISVDRPRPNTIEHTSNHPQQSPFDRLKNNYKKIQPLTSLNFHDDTKRSYNTFDDRSRLNSEIQMFASRIRHQGKLIKSIELSKTRTSGLKQHNNTTSVDFKTNIAKRSFFYKQFKNFLYSSFKVDGKPVQIKRDRYSIESHGLPKKKSIYSFKQKNCDFFAFNKTDVLRKKVIGRYDLQGDTETSKLQDLGNSNNNNRTNKHRSIYQDEILLQVNRSLHVRGNDGRKKQKGKLIRGRPPTTLVCNED